MRTAAFTILLFVAFGYAAESQKFTLLPQVGFENSKVNLSYNELPDMSPAGIVFSPQVSARLIYQSKAGHGLFLGAATSRASVPFRFADPETGMSQFVTHTGDMQVRLESGYQFSSKKISLNKKSTQPAKATEMKTGEKKNCSYGNAYRSYCMKYKSEASRPSTTPKAKPNSPAAAKGTWMKLQPSLGLGYIPGVSSNIMTGMQGGQPYYEYRSGNFTTALLAGMGIELGKNNNRLMTLSVNYVRGIGNLGTETITTQSGAKTLTTHLQSEVSGWNMRIGIPFSLGEKKPVAKPVIENKIQQPRKNCDQYRTLYRCTKTI